jgi:hypothetical protein
MYSAHAPNAYELTAKADTNWSERRSTVGFAIMLAGASINPASRRQHCITMSSTEAKLVGLADCAIELIHVDNTLHHIRYRRKGPIKVGTDNKGAHTIFATGSLRHRTLDTSTASCSRCANFAVPAWSQSSGSLRS